MLRIVSFQQNGDGKCRPGSAATWDNNCEKSFPDVKENPPVSEKAIGAAGSQFQQNADNPVRTRNRNAIPQDMTALAAYAIRKFGGLHMPNFVKKRLHFHSRYCRSLRL